MVRRDDGYRHGFEDEVLDALRALPEHQRTAIVLCDIESMSYEEISETLGMRLGTVKSSLHRALGRMRVELEGLGFETCGSQSPIISLLVGEDAATFQMAKRLQEEGVFVNPVMTPAVPAGQLHRCKFPVN